MERSAALALTSRIEATWSDKDWPQSRFGAWTDALEDLDEGAAGTAFARLRSTHPAPLTIAEFVAATKALRTDDVTATEQCKACAGMGWVDAEDIVTLHKDGTEDQRYSAVKPCDCRGAA